MTSSSNEEIPNVLNISDEYTLAAFYNKYFDDGNYIFSSKTATWFYYDRFNVLRESSTKNPFKLKSEICKKFVEYFRGLQEKAPEEQREMFSKTIKTVGSAGFSDNIISFLRTFNSNDDIENLADSNQNVLAFNNGFLYDIQANEYRPIEKEDFITKTMSIPFVENVPESASEQIYKIMFSFFENEDLTDYF